MVKLLKRQLTKLRKFHHSFEKTIRSYLSMPNLKSISFEMTGGGGGGGSVCYPKDPM